MKIGIVKYKSEDYKKAVKLRNKILREPLGIKMTEDFLAQDEQDIHFGIFEDDKILVSLTYKIIDETTIIMRQVATDEHLQGKGFGKKLVLFSEKHMAEKGYSHIILHARNTAVYFYNKLNYTAFGEEFEEVGLPHIKMEKYIKKNN